MKGFKDTTKTQRGPFNFARSVAPVKAHTRAMPTKIASGGDPTPRPRPQPLPPVTLAKGGALNAADRKAMPKSEFGLPGRKAYPMPDRSHAANAKARATQMVNAGKLSESSKAKIDAKANRILKKAEGGSVDLAQDKKLVAAAVHKHERHDHPGEPLTKMKKGGVPVFSAKPMLKGGC
jgi:hypothetical protein